MWHGVTVPQEEKTQKSPNTETSVRQTFLLAISFPIGDGAFYCLENMFFICMRKHPSEVTVSPLHNHIAAYCSALCSPFLCHQREDLHNLFEFTPQRNTQNFFAMFNNNCSYLRFIDMISCCCQNCYKFCPLSYIKVSLHYNFLWHLTDILLPLYCFLSRFHWGSGICFTNLNNGKLARLLLFCVVSWGVCCMGTHKHSAWTAQGFISGHR